MSTNTRIRSTKKYKALIAADFSDDDAMKILAPEAKAKKKGKGKKAKAQAPAELTAKQVAEALVAQRGLAFTRGRVYTNGPIIEAQVRVLKTGTPEVVQTSGVGRIVAVLIYREDSGDVAVQNLAKPV